MKERSIIFPKWQNIPSIDWRVVFRGLVCWIDRSSVGWPFFIRYGLWTTDRPPRATVRTGRSTGFWLLIYQNPFVRTPSGRQRHNKWNDHCSFLRQQTSSSTKLHVLAPSPCHMKRWWKTNKLNLFAQQSRFCYLQLQTMECHNIFICNAINGLIGEGLIIRQRPYVYYCVDNWQPKGRFYLSECGTQESL